jgi:chemotaxis protein MotA
LILAAIFMESGIDIFMSTSSLMIVLGGTIAAIFISYPVRDVWNVMKVSRKLFKEQDEEPALLALELISLAKEVKRKGVLRLPEMAAKLNNSFITKGAQLIADGFEEDLVKQTLQKEMILIKHRHKLGREMFGQMGKYAPAFGMIGTLIGLVQMLSSLEDPASIGPRMSLAILTTFYGAVLANLFFIPMASKLKRRSELESMTLQLCFEAIMSIKSGETLSLMQDKLDAFLSGQKAFKKKKPKPKPDTA